MSRRGYGSGYTLKIILYLALIFSIYPLIAGALNITTGSAPYSIYNEGSTGLSSLRSELINSGYSLKVIVSSLKALEKINSTGLLVIVGPTRDYDFQEIANLAKFLMRGGSILIADDFGKANSLLKIIWTTINLGLELVGQESQIRGVYFNTTAVLMDTGSFQKNPAAPVITNFADTYGILPPTVNRILTNFPATISMEVYDTESKKTYDVPLPAVASLIYSTPYSWLETNLTSVVKGQATPDPWEWGGISFSVGAVLPLIGNGKLALISDPDIFANQQINNPNFDNLDFALGLIGWLTSGEKTIIFDEAHLAHLPSDPLFGIGLWYMILVEASSSWVIAPLLPILLFIILTGYLPRGETFKPILFSHVKRVKPNSWFESKLRWYKRTRNYKSALTALMNHILSEISKKYGVSGENWNEILNNLLSRRPDISANRNEIFGFFEEVTHLVDKKKRIKEEVFTRLVEEFHRISEILLS